MRPYRIIGTIAAGGMGEVYRAQHIETGRIVALKTVRTATREAHFQGLRREIYALARLRHPGVVRFIEEGVEDGTPWCAMELVEGETLRDRLRVWWGPFGAIPGSTQMQGTTELPEEGAPPGTQQQATRGASPPPREAVPPQGARAEPPPAAGGHLVEALTIARQLCQTLATLHGEGVIHRDLKPENIVLPAGGPPVLVDFGIALDFAGAAGREVMDAGYPTAGTPWYMAPEQIQGLPLDARADLYALGCVIFELLCGAAPFPAGDRDAILQQHLTRNAPRPSTLAAGIPPALEALVLSLLAKSPQQRLGYAEDAGAALEALGGLPSPVLAAYPPRTYLYRSRFTGRTALVERLRAELAAAGAEQPRFVFLSGQSGLGKTRVALELARTARTADVLVASGECAPWPSAAGGAAHGLELQAFRPLLRLVADRCHLDGPERTEELLAERCRTLEQYEPALAQLPGRDRYPSPPALPPQDARDRVLRSMVEVLLACAQRWPLLLLVDDVQWADELTIGVLALLAAGVVGPPERPPRLMTLVTCRSEEPLPHLGPLRSGAAVLHLPLGGLAPGEVRCIVEDMTACLAPPQGFLDFLVAQCGGNPFFASEYLKAALAEGLLVREQGRWHFHPPPEKATAGAPIPSPSRTPIVAGDGSAERYRALLAPRSIQELLAPRLQGLSPATEPVLGAAAVLGREWDQPLLAAVAQIGAAAADDAVEELRLHQIIEAAEFAGPAEGAGPAGRFRFAHDKIQEAAYARIPPPERAGLHRRAAEALAASLARRKDAPGGALSHAGVLAYHYRLGGVPDQAFHHAREAGRHAMAVGTYREAAEHITTALELAGMMDECGHSLDALEHAELLRRHAEALYGLGSLDAMGRRLREAAAALRMNLPESWAGWCGLILRQMVPLLAHRLLVKLWMLAKDDQRARLEEAAVLIAGLEQYYMYRSQMLPLIGSLVLSADISERAGALVPLSRAQARLANILGILGFRRVSGYYFRLSGDNAARSGDLVAGLEHARTEAFYHVSRARFREAQALLGPCLSRSLAAGLPHQSEQSLIVLSMLHLDQGELQEADAVLAQLGSSARGLGHAFHENSGKLLLAYAALLRGRLREAQQLAAAAEEHFGADGELVLQLQGIGLGAGALLLRGDLDGAIDKVQKAYEPALAPALSHYMTFYLHRFGPSVFLCAWARAQQRGESAEDWARRALHSYELARRHVRINRAAGPFALRHRGRLLLLQGHAARARRALLRGALLGQELGMRLDEALARHSLARPVLGLPAPERQAEQQRAVTLFAQLGCTGYLEALDIDWPEGVEP